MKLVKNIALAMFIICAIGTGVSKFLWLDTKAGTNTAYFAADDSASLRTRAGTPGTVVHLSYIDNIHGTLGIKHARWDTSFAYRTLPDNGKNIFKVPGTNAGIWVIIDDTTELHTNDTLTKIATKKDIINAVLTGPTGPSGIDGTNGINGSIGATGIQGIQGVTGIHGITGATGLQGLTGATGASGSQGIVGNTGATGSTGVSPNPLDTAGLSYRIDLKLNKTDTSSLSNRINAKLNISDTSALSNRVNQKLNLVDTVSLSNRITRLKDTIGLKAYIGNISSVGFSGSYSDLLNKPTLPSAFDSIQFFNRTGRIYKKFKILIDTVTVTSNSNFSINITTAGFTNILSANAIGIKNVSGAFTSVPNVAIESMTTTALNLNFTQGSNNLVTLLGIGVLSGAATLGADISGLKVAIIVIGY